MQKETIPFYMGMKIFVPIFLVLIPVALFAQGIVLNELVSSNHNGITDEDGETADWIELYNNTEQNIDLSTYYISDDSQNLSKWQFPATTFSPSAFMLLFASGKDRKNLISHWETIIDQGDSWSYLPVSSAQQLNWISNTYNDTDWQKGPTGIGYGDGDDATVISNTLTLYMRKNFFLADTATVKSILLHIDYDDAFVAYLNGNEAARSNIGSPGERPAYNQWADTYREAEMYQGGSPEKFDISGEKGLLIPGKNVLAIEIHNYDPNSSDLTAIPFLTLGMTNAPLNARGVNPILDVPANAALHTNFKLGDDESLYLSDGQTILDSVHLKTAIADYSYGRISDAAGQWSFFAEPTPGASNNLSEYRDFSGEVTVSAPSGFYKTSLQVVISKELPTDSVFYTLDGSDPDRNDFIYNAPLTISGTTILRARTFSSTKYPGPVETKSYIFEDQSQLAVVSLVTDPPNLWDENSGIYVKGPNAQAELPFFGANFWQDWEKPAHIEFFDENGELGFSSNCGIKIFGAWSRANAQKSMSVFFRGEYGNPSLKYKLFKNSEISEYESFILRNSGNDWDATAMRDAFMQSLLDDIDVDKQNYRPVAVYLNGEYWGILNIREKINEHFIASHHNTDPDNINLLENQGVAVTGNASEYNTFLSGLQSLNLSTSQGFEFLTSHIDLDEFLNYQIAQIYFNNTDWPGNNIKFWKSNELDARWRWILYDTDFGFALYEPEAYKINTLNFALEEQGPGWPNPPWSTFIFRKVLENPQAKNMFINRMADLLNTSFKADKVLNCLDSLNNKIMSELPRHQQRWGHSSEFRNYHLQLMHEFAHYRATYLAGFTLTRFGLNGMSAVKVDSDNDGGYVRVNSVYPETYPWQGFYYNGIPVEVQAIAKSGYKFTGWTGSIESNQGLLTIDPIAAPDLTAHFEQMQASESEIVINEINYNSADDFDSGDWVEFVNAGNEIADLSGWIFKDENDDHQFIFPAGTMLKPDSFIVLADNDSLFSDKFSDPVRIMSINFGFSGSGELLRLFDAAGVIIDSLTYNDNDPWPLEADGAGASLELLNPGRDNSIAQNWKASAGYGSPGRINSVYTSLEQEEFSILPDAFSLHQNYPNPFNPDTRIMYDLSQNAYVNITVFDISGKIIKRIIDKNLNAGTYKIKFNANEVASGIYILKMTINNKLQFSKKMILLR
ncbi:MAG: CotH kinase family protein [Calditrichaeota bacterium]|nr:CotH kinase family protein [Calditrichota bacterium]